MLKSLTSFNQNLIIHFKKDNYSAESVLLFNLMYKHLWEIFLGLSRLCWCPPIFFFWTSVQLLAYYLLFGFVITKLSLFVRLYAEHTLRTRILLFLLDSGKTTDAHRSYILLLFVINALLNLYIQCSAWHVAVI